MTRRFRPNKAQRALLKSVTGRTSLYESDKLSDIRVDGTKYDSNTDNERENWFVTAKVSHKAKYGYHYGKRMMNRAKNQHPTGCHVETPTTPTVSRHDPTQLPDLPRRDLPTVSPFNLDGNSEPRYKARSHQETPRVPREPRQGIIHNCRSNRTSTCRLVWH